MKITLRNKQFNINMMNTNRLLRIIKCLEHERALILNNTLIKDGYSPRYRMLDMTILILKEKASNKIKNTRKLVINRY